MVLLLSALLVLAALWLWRLPSGVAKWRRSRTVRRALEAQGIHGPHGNPLFKGVMIDSLKRRYGMRGKELDPAGNVAHHLQPDFALYSKLYGVPFLVNWDGDTRLITMNPDIIREILSRKAAFTGKSQKVKEAIVRLLGYGLVSVDGDEWALHRRVVSPAFHPSKLRAMTNAFVACAATVLDKWGDSIAQSGSGEVEIDVLPEFIRLTADVISRTAFGSSFAEGQKVFRGMDLVARLMSKQAMQSWLPLNKLLPTATNRNIWRLHREIDRELLQIIEARRKAMKAGESAGEDLLGLVLDECKDNPAAFGNQSVMGECKTFYLAGHETTSSLLTWAVYHLSIHQEWQERAREEVIQVCKGAKLEMDMLSRLKVVGMILNETLRLYPPAIMMHRTCLKDMEVGGLYLPAGTEVEIPIAALHRDEELWGKDANCFNPERFANGASRASKHPNAFMAFSFGPRVCVGQTFATLEAKAVLSMLLTRFDFHLSPAYRHSPALSVTLKPFYGMPILLRRRSSNV